MTRETKIGLLVGLAFIIVIGILLSDHLTSSTDPPPARLTQAGDSVRGGTQVPNANHVALVPQLTPAPIIPQAQVPTPNDLNGQQGGSPVREVAIGPAQAQSPSTLMPQGQWQSTPTGSAQIGAPVRATSEVNPIYQQPPAAPQAQSAVASNDSRSHMAATAHQMGQDLVPVKSGQGAAPAATSGREYRAVSGDNLNRLAAKMPGGNTKANRDAIIAANPTLKANPNLIVVGRPYILPTAGNAVQSASTQKPAASTATSSVATSASHQDRSYTVKAGDSLWKIANEIVGDAHAVAQIKELNKQVLDGGDVVKVGMVLRLPARRVASAD